MILSIVRLENPPRELVTIRIRMVIVPIDNVVGFDERFLEALYNKTGCDDAAFKWLIDAVRPTLDKYNISTPAELGFDKPELWKENVYDMH